MKYIALTLAIGLGLAGCADPMMTAPAPGTTMGGAGSAGLGGAADPASPAYFRENVGDRVLFAVDQSTLGPDARAVLTAQARWLAANPAYSAVIEGHADEQGTRQYNLALGGRRANAARDFLLSQGIAAGRLRTISYGKERPLQICSTEACYSQNRRAVTVLATGGSV